MGVPDNLKYSKNHEWLQVGNDGVCIVGITDYAQELMGYIVYVGLPEVGMVVSADASCADLESLKAASDVHSPVSGKVVEVNENLSNDPVVVNNDPYGEGWLFKVKVKVNDVSSINALLDAAAYQALTESESSVR